MSQPAHEWKESCFDACLPPRLKSPCLTVLEAWRRSHHEQPRVDGGERGRTNFGSSRRSHGCPPFPSSLPLRLSLPLPIRSGIAQWANTCAALRGDFWLLIAYDERRRDADGSCELLLCHTGSSIGSYEDHTMLQGRRDFIKTF